MVNEVVFVVYTICEDFTLDGFCEEAYLTLEDAQKACSKITDERVTPTIKRLVIKRG